MSFDIVNYITTFLAIQSYSDDFIIPPPTNMLSLYNTSDWPGVGDFTGLSNITFMLLSSNNST